MKLSLVLPSVVVAIRATTVSAGYAASCDQYELNPNENTMETRCTPDDQSPRRVTREDLNLCIANDFGTLVARDNGGFAGSCSGCYAQGTILYCTCIQYGAPVRTNIDLNSFVENVNGRLYCFGHYGT